MYPITTNTNDQNNNKTNQEPILLLEPQHNQKNTPSTIPTKPTDSFLGGRPIYFSNHHPSFIATEKEDTAVPTGSSSTTTRSTTIRNATATNPFCKRCGRMCYLLLQMNAPLPGLERTLYVFGCNRANCVQSCFGDMGNTTTNGDTDQQGGGGRFGLGGGNGVLRCVRSQMIVKDDEEEEDSGNDGEKKEVVQSTASYWDDDNDHDGSDIDDDGGWGNDDDDDDSEGWGGGGDNKTERLEAMLTAMEVGDGNTSTKTMDAGQSIRITKPITDTTITATTTTTAQTTISTTTTHSNETIGGENDTHTPSFPCIPLHMYDEPSPPPPTTTRTNRHSRRSPNNNQNHNNNNNNDEETNDTKDSGDSDDEGLGLGATTSDSKIQSLLSRYLAEEEDEDVLKALGKGGGGGGGGGDGGDGRDKESYERESAEQKSFLAFTDRIRRAPYQVVRYLWGGVPLWSVPIPLTPAPHKKKITDKNDSKNSNKKKKKTVLHRDPNFPIVPNCPCGSPRSFEFQIMPSLLQVLNVDRYCDDGNNNGGTDGDNDTRTHALNHVLRKDVGGMNWGVIAVYACASSCAGYDEEYVVVQESTDGEPKDPVSSTAGVVDGDNDDNDDNEGIVEE